jgi:hypothetical protein
LVRFYDDGQGPTPSRHLVDASPELANRIRVAVWPSWPSRNVTDAHAGFASEKHLGNGGSFFALDCDSLDVPAEVILELAPSP